MDLSTFRIPKGDKWSRKLPMVDEIHGKIEVWYENSPKRSQMETFSLKTRPIEIILLVQLLVCNINKKLQHETYIFRTC
jgi:hypothetical protein